MLAAAAEADQSSMFNGPAKHQTLTMANPDDGKEFDPLQQHHQHLKQLQIQVRLVQLSTSFVITSKAPIAPILE